MRTHPGEDGHYADCLKSKAESPINGGLAFLLEEKGVIELSFYKRIKI